MGDMEIESLLAKYKGRKVLVTGHTGFKGSWLSIWLDLLGAEVVGVALDPKTGKDNYVLTRLSEYIKDIRTDIRDFDKLLTVFQEEKPEVVFHLAARSLVLDGYKSPLVTFETNTLGTANVLEAIRMTPSVQTAVMITTDKVYENKEWIWPYREEEKLGGYDPYSASKGAAELIISSYRNSFFNPLRYKEHHKSIASVRAGNVIGGGDWAENRIVPDCVRALEEDIPIEIRNPDSVRPWQHVLEPLGGYLLLGAKMMEAPDKYTEAWNFGPEQRNIIRVRELVDLIINKYGKGKWLDRSCQDVLHEAKMLALDINKARYKLNWEPVMDMEETVSLTVDWYKKYRETDVSKLCRDQIEYYTSLWKSGKEK